MPVTYSYWLNGRWFLQIVDTVTPFKFAAIKVRGFEIMTYSRPFNFAVSYQNYFTVSYTNVKDHQVLRLEHRLGLMEILNKRPLGLTAPLSNCLCYTNDV